MTNDDKGWRCHETIADSLGDLGAIVDKVQRHIAGNHPDTVDGEVTP
jgi:hypothetical protein